MRAKGKCFSPEDNGLSEVLHLPELVVPSGETDCKVAQRHWAVGVSLRAKGECFSAEDNGLSEVLHLPELVIPGGELICKVARRR